MPYYVVKRGNEWCVEKKDGGKPLGCHGTKGEADKQMAALYANEPTVMKGLRYLHPCDATSAARTEMLNGREYLVIPVVALMEGIIWPHGANTPEFVPVATLLEAAGTWDDKPIVVTY